MKRDFDDITSPDKAARRSSFCCYTDDNLNRFRTSSAGEEQRDDDTEAGTAALADHAQAGTAYKRFGVFFMQHQHASEA